MFNNKFKIVVKDNECIPIPTKNFSIRQNAVIFFEGSYYMYADVIEWDNPYHPASYNSSIHMYKSNDAENWEYKGEVIEKGKTGVATPGACVFKGKIYLAYSVRGNPNGSGHRTLGMSVAEKPEGPFRKVSNLNIAPPEEDYSKNNQTLLLDDPYLVPCNKEGTGPGNDKLYIYFRRSVRHGDKYLEYGIWNSYITGLHDVWSKPELRVPVSGEEVIESADARWINNKLILLCMKYNEEGAVVAYSSPDNKKFYKAEPYALGYLDYMPSACSHLIGLIQDSDGEVRHMTMPGLIDDEGHYTMFIKRIEIIDS